MRTNATASRVRFPRKNPSETLKLTGILYIYFLNCQTISLTITPPVGSFGWSSWRGLVAVQFTLNWQRRHVRGNRDGLRVCVSALIVRSLLLRFPPGAGASYVVQRCKTIVVLLRACAACLCSYCDCRFIACRNARECDDAA